MKTETALSAIKEIQDGQNFFWGWVCQLSKLAQQNDHKDGWDIFGHGLVIESKDHDLCAEYVRLSCESIEVQFQCLTYSQLIEADSIVNPLDLTPKVIILERDTWYLADSEDPQSHAKCEKLDDIIKGLKGRAITLIVIADSYLDVAVDLRREGLFDRHIHWNDPCQDMMVSRLFESVGYEIFEKSVIDDSHRLGCLLQAEYSMPRKFGLLKTALRRLAYFENRKINWLDILRIVADGTGEGCHIPEIADRAKIAAHEAGHALITIIESNGEHIPEITTIQPGKGYSGMMIDDYAYMYRMGDFLSLREAHTKIRVALAGRAAEELIYGSGEVDIFLARDDLNQATRIALDLVAKAGFSSQSSSSQEGVCNLLVCKDDSFKQDEFYKSEARALLAEQYKSVIKCLSNKRTLLEKIIQALRDKKLLTQAELKKIVDQADQCQLVGV